MRGEYHYSAQDMAGIHGFIRAATPESGDERIRNISACYAASPG